ncbi:MAG: nucleoside phosphorylase [Candidatus Thermoplasmatota archaeon]|nr:nucleoside phosphorylase [Candidatus Thermoplasmatota archaeon]
MSKQLITGLERGQVSEYVILCGEPERVRKISSFLEDPEEVVTVREFTVHKGLIGDTPVTVASTGIGGPSTAILVEELANLGAKTFMRIGTSGGIADGLEKGDFVIASGAVRLDGTSRSYAWTEYPALASYDVMAALVDSATRAKERFDVGVCLSVDGFYSENKTLTDGRISPMSHSGYMPSFMADRLGDAKMMNVKNIEMENGTIFTLCSLFGLRAGAICTISDVVPWHPTEKAIDFEQNMSDCIRVGVDAMRTLITWDAAKGTAVHWCPSHLG